MLFKRKTWRFFKWVATSPISSALKVAVAAALAWALSNVDTFKLSPVVQVIVTAVIPVIINWLNPADNRYGIGAE